MKLFDSLKKFAKLRVALGFLIVGLVIAIISGVIFVTPDSGNYEAVEVTITSIEEYGTDDDIRYSVYVKYNVGGENYETLLGGYDSTWEVGDTLEVEYNVDDPTELRYGNGKTMSLIICIIGVIAFAYGLFSLIKGIKTPASEFAQYDRVKEIDEAEAEEIKNRNEQSDEYVFHFTGKLNQSYVMKNKYGEPVYEAICNGVKLVKNTEFEFKNCKTGESSTKMISHTVTDSYGDGTFGTVVKSSFKIDGKSCWDVLAEMGYGFDFSLNGIKAHYDVRHQGVNIGYVELGGTGLMNEKYKDNPLGKMPTNGIFKIECPESEIEGMFLICFCITKTESTLS